MSFPGLGANDGAVQVSAFGATSTRCKVVRTSGVPDLLVEVACFGERGAYKDSEFVVYFESNDVATTPNYFNAHALVTTDATPGGGGVTAVEHFWNSSGQSVSASRLGAGSYEVLIEGHGAVNAVVNVTAVGKDRNQCNVAGYTADTAATTVTVHVVCRSGWGTTAGEPADTNFNIRLEYRGSGGDLDGYLFASKPGTQPTYIPTLQFNATGAYNLSEGVDHTATDTFPGLPATNSAALVTATDWTELSWCNVTDWFAAGSDTKVTVACYAIDSTYGYVYPVELTHYSAYMTH